MSDTTNSTVISVTEQQIRGAIEIAVAATVDVANKRDFVGYVSSREATMSLSKRYSDVIRSQTNAEDYYVKIAELAGECQFILASLLANAAPVEAADTPEQPESASE